MFFGHRTLVYFELRLPILLKMRRLESSVLKVELSNDKNEFFENWDWKFIW